MKLGISDILVVTVLAVMLCSVASAGNVNPLTITMEGKSVVGPGIGGTGPIEGDLEGTIYSVQEFTFYTNSKWWVEVMIHPYNEWPGPYPPCLLAEGSTIGENTVALSYGGVLMQLGLTLYDPLLCNPESMNPRNWDKNQRHMFILYYTLYSEDKLGTTYVTDYSDIWWDANYLNPDGTLGAWRQTHHYEISSDGETEIPEFSTIAIPVAGMLGLLFLFSRKRKKEE